MPSDITTRPPLDATRLAGLLAEPARAAAGGWQVEVLEQTGSTNAEVAARARAGAPEGTVVVTEHQTAGRGRLDRVWTTPPRTALTFSVLLRPAAPAAAWPWLPLLTGVAVVEALAPLGLPVGLKWPNDVVLADPAGAAAERKLAGILLERVETPDGPAAVVGCGLNTDLTAEELPVPTAGSLALALGRRPDRTALLADLLAALATRYAAWSRPVGAAGAVDPGPLHAAYTGVCTTLGRDVRVELPAGGLLTGRASAIDAGGGLVVDALGGRVVVGAGDVVHVRPDPPGPAAGGAPDGVR